MPAGTGLELYTVTSVQGSFTVEATDTLASAFFGVSNGTRDVYFSHNGTTRYSHFTTPLVVLHNEIGGLQGGTTDEYYHLTSAQTTALHGVNDANSSSQASNANLTQLATYGFGTGANMAMPGDTAVGGGLTWESKAADFTAVDSLSVTVTSVAMAAVPVQVLAVSVSLTSLSAQG